MVKSPSGLLPIKAFDSLRLKQFTAATIGLIAKVMPSFANALSLLLALLIALLIFLAVPFYASAAPPTKGSSFAIKNQLSFTAQEIALIGSFGPWPVKNQSDPSNALSGNPLAIALGGKLFVYKRLSKNNDLSCASCHQANKGFSDGLAVSQGRIQLQRNSQSLWNLKGQNWFAWDGSSDSLWLHSLKPMLHPDEMGASLEHIAGALRSDAAIAAAIEKLPLHNIRIGANTPSEQRLALSAAKALAAYVETLQSKQTAFDRFRDALMVSNPNQATTYPLAAQRGLKLFINKGNCISCHAGPNFSNGEFADIGVGHFRKDRSVDSGRHAGASSVLKDPYNLLGQFSDVAPSEQTHTRFIAMNHTLFGQFKVPSLRELVHTAPYMHDGRIATLKEVIKHYSSVGADRLHSDGDKSLKALNLSESESDDLVAFLETLSAAPTKTNNLLKLSKSSKSSK